MSERLERIREALEEEGLDALWISSPIDDVNHAASQNREYVSGFTGSAGHVLVTRDRALIALDSRYWEQGEHECAPRGVDVWKREGRHGAWVPAFLREAGLESKKVGFSQADMTVGEFAALQKAAETMPWALRPQFGPAGPIVERLRAKKDREELARLQKAIDIADLAFAEVAAALQPGMTEQAVAEQVAQAVRAHGGSGVSFPTIVASGAWGALPHGSPRPEPIADGAPVVIDMGAMFGGYCSDLTRTVVAGEGAPPAKFREVYEVVFAAQQAAIEGVEAGMTGAQAHELAHSVIRDAGYGDQFGHGLGHGVGLQVHETPYLGPTSEDVLEDGMVFTIEPGVYLPGEFGVRIEDIVVLEDGKARVLSHASKLTPMGG